MNKSRSCLSCIYYNLYDNHCDKTSETQLGKMFVKYNRCKQWKGRGYYE